ncbi:hypothetical protein [Candidatus Ruminimicrobiellum ovillum]|uniref:hypothetical protein n=1 Tax=Candidatus Ruminimicrobiellum ovillum TaxID=1947927 RepID=UPI003559869D
MKKVFSLLAVLALVSMVSSSVWAVAFSSSQHSAYATFTAEDLTFDVTLYHWNGTSYSTDTTATAINFDAADVVLGTTTASVAISSDFAKIHSNLKIQKAGTTIYMFTDNKNSSMGEFQAYQGKVNGSTTTYNGLVRAGQTSTSTYTDGDFAEIQTKCLAVSSSTLTSLTSPKSLTFDNDNQYAGDRWLADKSNIYEGNKTLAEADVDGSMHVIGKTGAAGGNWIGGTWTDGNYVPWFVDEDVVMFFKAVFSNVSSGDKFGTTTITFSISAE